MRKLLYTIFGLLLSAHASAAVLKTVEAGETNVTVFIKIIDLATGAPEPGVVFNTSGIDLEYCREYAACVDINEADLTTPALTDAHADGGFLATGHGYYRLDLPDAAVAVGVSSVLVQGTVTDMIVVGGVVELSPPVNVVAWDHTTVTPLIDAADVREEIDNNSTQLAGIIEDTGTTLPTLIDALPTAAEVVDEWETQSQADPTNFHVNVMEQNGTPQTANDDGADINTLLTNLTTLANALAIAEPSSVPSFAADPGEVLSWLLVLSRNEIRQTAGTKTIRNDANDADLATCDVSDDSTTFVREECL